MSQNLFESIIQDIDNYSVNIAKFAAIEIRDKMYDAAINAIDKFYSDYTPGDHYRANHPEGPSEQPWFYDRTGNLKNSVKKYYKKNYYDNSFTVGIDLSPDFMEDVYNGSPDLIYYFSIEKGYHGHDAWEGMSPYKPYAVTKPSPLKLIQRKYNQLQRELESGKVFDRAEKKARKLSKYI